MALALALASKVQALALALSGLGLEGPGLGLGLGLEILALTTSLPRGVEQIVQLRSGDERFVGNIPLALYNGKKFLFNTFIDFKPL